MLPLVSHFLSQVIPLFFQSAHISTLTVPKGPHLWSFALEQPTPAPGAIVFMGGRGSALLLYADTLLYFFQKGWDVYGVDLQGFGFSQRLAPNPHMSHILKFESYAQDLQRHLEWKNQRRVHPKTYLVTGSMGALVALMHNARFRTPWAGAVFLAPMVGLAPVGFPMGAVRVVSGLMRWLGAKEIYAYGQGDYAPGQGFCLQYLTTSVPRCRLRDALFSTYPDLQNGGVSWGWLHGAFRAMDQVPQLTALWTTPTEMVLAEADNRVDNGKAQSFCTLAKNCKRVVVEEAYHDLLNGPEGVRSQVLKKIGDWVQ